VAWVEVAITSPLAQLVVLGVVSLLVRHAVMPGGESSTAAAAIVMAGGIFALDAFQRIPLPDLSMLTRLVVLELVVIWVLIAQSYLSTALHGRIDRYTADPVNRFAVGTWVAATGVLGEALLLSIPEWHFLVVGLWLLTTVLWVWFLLLAVSGFWAIAIDPTREHARGSILLSTVSTQAVLLLAVAVFPGEAPPWAVDGALVLGSLFYVAGTALIVVRYAGQRRWAVADDWSNTNCIVHGAVSITGLAALSSGAVTGRWLIPLWLWAACMFLVVESVEVVRARCRVRAYGWKDGLFTYHVSQWARNFTFGMFFAFTLHIWRTAPNAGGIPALGDVWSVVVSCGQYCVLALLVIEIVLFVQGNVWLFSVKATNSRREKEDDGLHR
jgi:hypothetical protein